MQTHLVDELGFLLAQISDLEKKADAIKKELKASGCDSFDGELYHASVSKSVRITLDSKKIREEMGAAWCDDRSNMSEVCTVKVTARLAKAA